MADAKRKVVVDGIPLEVDDTAAAAIDKLVKQRDEAVSAKDAAELKLKTEVKVGDKVFVVGDGVAVAAAVAKLITDHAAQVDTLKKDVVTPEARDAMVAEWSKLITDAKRLAPELVTDGKTCLAIRREVIAAVSAKDATAKAVADAVLAGKALDTAEPEHVRSTFNALSAAVKTDANDAETRAADAAVADALTGAGKSKETQTELTGRDKFVARQSQAWQKQ